MMKSQKLQKYDSLLQTVSQKPVTNIIQPNETQNRKCLKTVIIRDFGGKEKEKNVCVCVRVCMRACVCVRVCPEYVNTSTEAKISSDRGCTGWLCYENG